MAISSVIFLISVGIVFYHYHDGLGWLDSFYFTVMTVMTIGYGDYHPTGDTSKLFTTFYVLVSVPTLLFYLGWIVESRISRKIFDNEQRVDQAKSKLYREIK
jgi:hypothetical protein